MLSGTKLSRMMSMRGRKSGGSVLSLSTSIRRKARMDGTSLFVPIFDNYLLLCAMH